MKMEMTEKDKKLLVFLSIFVIVVCFGYWGIYPNIKAMQKIEMEKQEQEDIKTINETKLMQVPMFEADNEQMEQDIINARDEFYPMMNSSEVDKYFTNFVLGYNLYAYDMSIEMPKEECKLEPYQYSEKAALLEQMEEETIATGAVGEQNAIADAEAAANDNLDALYVFDEETNTGIYMATISLRLGGTKSQLLKLIDDLSNTDKKLRVKNYSWSTERSVQYSTDVDETLDYEVVSEEVLNITLEIFMCEE